jgi:hypothetical protein
MDAMSDQDGDQGPQRAAGRRRRLWPAARLGVLLAILVALVAYVVARPGEATRRSATRCVAATGVPEVEQVAPGAVGGLREAVARVLPQRVGRLYEEGTVRAGVAWTDEEPSPPATSPRARRPGGYEMRWWAPNGDDVVADVLVFASPARAQRFLALASSSRCRDQAAHGAALRPPLAHNLSWLNPDGAVQADVFVARGARVYRVADAPAGSSPEQVRNSGGLGRAFATIDVLACLLPSAHCTQLPNSVTT